MTTLHLLTALSLLLDAVYVCLLLALGCLVGECVIQAIEMFRDMLEERRRAGVPRFESIGDYE